MIFLSKLHDFDRNHVIHESNLWFHWFFYTFLFEIYYNIVYTLSYSLGLVTASTQGSTPQSIPGISELCANPMVFNNSPIRDTWDTSWIRPGNICPFPRWSPIVKWSEKWGGSPFPRFPCPGPDLAVQNNPQRGRSPGNIGFRSSPEPRVGPISLHFTMGRLA